jgi:hypothetical protein
MKLKGESGVTKPGDYPLRSERSRAAAENDMSAFLPFTDPIRNLLP